MSPLRWTCLSAAKLAAALSAEGHPVSGRSVNCLLHRLGYSLQANRKKLEGRQHPDRDAQFQRIYRKVQEFQDKAQPAVSVPPHRSTTASDRIIPGVSATAVTRCACTSAAIT